MSEEKNINGDNSYHFKSREVFGSLKTPEIVVWLKKKGILKNEKVIKYVLIGVIIFCFGLAGILFAHTFGLNNSTEEQYSGYDFQMLR